MKGFNSDNLKYGDVLNTPLSEELWDLLNEPENIIRMETASYLKRPALEAIQPQLLKKLDGKNISEAQLKRYKQLMGIMAKQVMVNNRGYQVAKTAVKIRIDEGLFKTATSYKNK